MIEIPRYDRGALARGVCGTAPRATGRSPHRPSAGEAASRSASSFARSATPCLLATARVFGLAAVAVLAAAGCSNQPKLYPVSGTVTFDGQPVETGDILFISAAGDRGPDAAKIADGKYTVQTTAGTKRVEVSASRIRPGGAKGAGGEPVPEEYIPARYNIESQLTAEVKAEGSNTFDFALRSQGP
jgi:hypothetical protein